MRFRELVVLLRRLPARAAVKVLSASAHGRSQLAELLAPEPGHIGPVARLERRTLVACGDHFMWIANGDRGVAIEPEESNATLLRDNVSLNELTVGVEIVGKAAGAQKGVSYLQLHGDDSGMHTLTGARTDAAVEVAVDTIPSILDDLRIPPEDISFIWMDIERSEFDVFPTIEELLRRRTPVFFEYGRFAVTDEQYDHWSAAFDRCGYECYVIDRGVASGPMTSAEALNIEFGNVLLV